MFTFGDRIKNNIHIVSDKGRVIHYQVWGSGARGMMRVHLDGIGFFWDGWGYRWIILWAGGHIFLGILVCVCVGGGGQNSVFVKKKKKKKKEKKMSQLLGGELPSDAPFLIHFQFLFFQTEGNLKFLFLHQDQEFIIFFSGCWNLSANLFTGFMILVPNIQ